MYGDVALRVDFAKIYKVVGADALIRPKLCGNHDVSGGVEINPTHFRHNALMPQSHFGRLFGQRYGFSVSLFLWGGFRGN